MFLSALESFTNECINAYLSSTILPHLTLFGVFRKKIFYWPINKVSRKKIIIVKATDANFLKNKEWFLLFFGIHTYL